LLYVVAILRSSAKDPSRAPRHEGAHPGQGVTEKRAERALSRFNLDRDKKNESNTRRWPRAAAALHDGAALAIACIAATLLLDAEV
jgi:hypothetical protein